MEFTADMMLRQAWSDPRLAWSHIPRFANYTKNIVTPKFRDEIWLPDLFFRNGKQGRLHKMTCENFLIRIQPDGYVLYSQKITMRLACQMELQNFPMDTQKCGMNIGSYGYTLNQLRFVWRNETPVTLPKDIQISEFDSPAHVDTYDCSKEYSTSTGQYTCLQASFLLSRKLGHWFFVVYIPNILILIVSWLNFWVNLEALPARVNLSLLTLLGLITQASGYATTLPRVSYLKAIDIWTTACYAFNSGVLLEFAIALHVSRRKKISDWHTQVRKLVRRELVRWCYACQQESSTRGISANAAYVSDEQQPLPYVTSASLAVCTLRKRSVSGEQDQPLPELFGKRKVNSQEVMNKMLAQLEEYDAEIPAPPPKSPGAAQLDHLIPPPAAKGPPKRATVSEVDSYSRFLFPACFFIYNCFYWTYYLVLVHYQH
ncbi:unnamed protein product [Calicophoron daubneyi]|uniref:Uncharacterized protein n=1 Tax=Calicophoron daubneyi TaxID=300641 RepID=A0AAV2TL49_CALDB